MSLHCRKKREYVVFQISLVILRLCEYYFGNHRSLPMLLTALQLTHTLSNSTFSRKCTQLPLLVVNSSSNKDCTSYHFWVNFIIWLSESDFFFFFSITFKVTQPSVNLPRHHHSPFLFTGRSKWTQQTQRQRNLPTLPFSTQCSFTIVGPENCSDQTSI